MAAKPAALPRWGETTGAVVGPNETTPNSGKQDVGYVAGEKPPAQYENWLKRLAYKWLQYVSDAVFVATVGSALAGIDATGDGATPGGKFTPGGGGTPARGAVNLNPQAAPTAPVEGDVWYDSSARQLVYKTNAAVAPVPAVFGNFVEDFEATAFPPTARPGFAAPSPRFPTDLAYVRDTATPIFGTASANRPGAQTASTNSSLGLSVFLPSPSRLFFNFNVICNVGQSDHFDFYVDGVLTAEFSSRTGPTTESGRFVTDVLTEGAHTFDWRFVRGASASVGSEAAKVDQIEIIPESRWQGDPARFYWFDEMVPDASAANTAEYCAPKGFQQSTAANAPTFGYLGGTGQLYCGAIRMGCAGVAVGDLAAIFALANSMFLNSNLLPTRKPFYEAFVYVITVANVFLAIGLVDSASNTAETGSLAQAELILDTAVSPNWQLRVFTQGVGATTINTGVAAAAGALRVGISVDTKGVVVILNGKSIPVAGASNSMCSNPTFTTGFGASPRLMVRSRTAAAVCQIDVDSHRLYALKA
jgi:hypothetical protein